MSNEASINPQNEYDYYYYRSEIDSSPDPTGFGLPKFKVNFVGLNSDGRCRRGLWFTSSGSILIKAEGRYEVDGDRIEFSWLDRTKATGHMSPDHKSLRLNGEVFKAPHKRL